MSNINDFVEYHQNFLETLADLVLELDEDIQDHKKHLKSLESRTTSEQDVWVLKEQYARVANLIRYKANLIETIDCILDKNCDVAMFNDTFFMKKKRDETHF